MSLGEKTEDRILEAIGSLKKGQEELSRDVQELTREVREFEHRAGRRMNSLEVGHVVNKSRMEAQERACREQLARERDIRRPWYTALVGAIVGALAGLIGGLVSLLLKG